MANNSRIDKSTNLNEMMIKRFGVADKVVLF